MSNSPAPQTPLRRAMVWGERALFGTLLVFALYRLGPQLGALTGVGPDLGSAPDYTFTALDGTRVDSEALKGQVVVLNFWATWCGPCKLEMPSLQSLHEDRGKDGVVVLGLATDAGDGSVVDAFLQEQGITYAVGRATSDHRRSFGGVSMIPTTYLIDRDGIIRHKILGYFAPPAMRVAVNRLVAEEPIPSVGTASAR